MIENIGLVLEGGGMRGVYTAGVLDFFMEKDIWFKNTVGVSAGACHGCSYVCRQKGRAKHISIEYVDNKEYCSFSSLIKTGDFFGEEFAYHRIPEELYPIDNKAFKENGMNLYAVVTNCETGEAEYMKIEDMFEDIEKVRACASLPLLSRFVKINGKDYLDGGVASSVPLKAFEDMGLEKNLVILTQPRDYKKSPNKALPLIKLKYRKYPKFIESMARRHETYNTELEYVRKREGENKVFVIAPEKSLEVSRIEKNKDKLRAVYETGYKDAEKAFTALKKFLKE